MIHIITPYATDKNLGKAYNAAMSLIPDNDWACLMDYDAMLLTPDAGKILHEYAERNPDAGLLTAKTNRVHPISKQQLYNGRVSEQPDIKVHMQIAENHKKHLYNVTPIEKENVSGFLMLISKKQWLELPFTEDLKCLGVDTDYSKKLRAAGKKILVMNGLYVFHQYRLLQGINNKSHLT